jgi:hypothetical protein
MASKENKCKYDKEEEVSMATSKKRWTFSDYNDDNGDTGSSSSLKEVSSEEKPTR